MKKELKYQILINEYEQGHWLNIDSVPADYHRFIVEEIAQHLNNEGLNKLVNYYKEMNKMGKNEGNWEGHFFKD